MASFREKLVNERWQVIIRYRIVLRERKKERTYDLPVDVR